MSEWNGRLIADMDTSHIENTIKLLEKNAKKACRKAGGSNWKYYVHNSYQDLVEEFNKRDVKF